MGAMGGYGMMNPMAMGLLPKDVEKAQAEYAKVFDNAAAAQKKSMADWDK